MNITFSYFRLSLLLLIFSACKKNNAENVNMECRDIDGNIYDTVSICSKSWTKENLKVSHYRNGDLIPQVQNNLQWENLSTGAWCWYNNDSTNYSSYGKLYNWYAINDSRGLAPAGWQIPTEGDWADLATCLGGEAIAGGKIKTRGTVQASTGLWETPNVTVDPYSNFNGRPGGYRDAPGSFIGLGSYNYWWSSTAANSTTAKMRVIINFLSNMNKGSFGNNYGFYVRCRKD
ncbi:MAG: fibrobacter succinogenes major paralogous domain-containing protein [Bacteroidota bacterium]